MRKLMVGVALCVLTAATASAQAPAAGVMAPIQKFVDTFNKGDLAGAASTHAAAADLVIVDELAPFAWHGVGAFTAWSAALDADAKKQGITEPSVKIGAPTRTEMSGDMAYVVVPVVYSFKLKGVAMTERAQMTYVLKKGPSGWLIHGWTWTGPKPSAAAAAKK
ncbi:MAG: nuclear transport factor 2 family protein [Vicinamibacterales bacterium]